MQAVREAWTDERLDDLNHRVDQIGQRLDRGFAEVREEFRAVRGEMREEFACVRGEMAIMNRTFVALFGTTIVGFAGTIATVLLQG